MLRNLLILSVAFFMTTAMAEKKKGEHAKSGSESLNIDTAASSVEWTGFKKLGDKHHGRIKIKDGKIDMKDGKLTGGTFTIDMTSITNDDLNEKPDLQKKLISHLMSAEFFNVGTHPTSSFKITSVTEKDGQTMVAGNLTMNGKTDKLEFPATIENKNGVMVGSAKIDVDRTKWGLVYGSGNFIKELTADKIINNNFELNLNLTARK